ncbi:MAG: chaperone modulator CbpM [Syntrophobacteraceae bacterium]|nr:chaperone modulator CbpM [Syntrophobacteraceae bacterium]
MSTRRFFMLQVKRGGEVFAGYTTTEVAARAGVHPDLIDRFVRLGLLEFSEGAIAGECTFDPEVVPLIGRILRLRNELGVNYAGVGVILELIARIEALESRVRELEGSGVRESQVSVS